MKDFSTPKKINALMVYAEPKVSAAPGYSVALENVRAVRKQWYFFQDRLQVFSEARDKLQTEIIQLQDQSLEMLQGGGDPIELSQQAHDKKVELADTKGWIDELNEKIEALRPIRAKAEIDWENAWSTAMRQEVQPPVQEEKNGYLEAASVLDASWFQMTRKLFRKMRLDGREEEDWPTKNVPSAISFPLRVDRERSKFKLEGTW
jgi:hypothetical protein